MNTAAGSGVVTVFGSVNHDQSGTVERLPRAGETVAGTTYLTSPGGKGANQALAARRAGAEARLVGARGNDNFGREVLAELERDGVDLSLVRVTDTSTGVALILVDDCGENVIAVLSGANGTNSTIDAELALADAPPGSVLLLQQEIPQTATHYALQLARDRGVVSILNIAPFLPTTKSIAVDADIVVANEEEFFALTACSRQRLESEMLAWAELYGRTVVVTRGQQGAVAVSARDLVHVPALKVHSVDTVGAGDTFCGYLAQGLSAGLELGLAMRRATVAASLACRGKGAQAPMPWTSEVAKFL